jgi:hypothetical protein
MNWYRLLKIAFAPYGYWVTETGERIPVELDPSTTAESAHCATLSHLKAQGKYENILGWAEDNCADLYGAAYDGGWARIVVYGGPDREGAVGMQEMPTPQQITTILSIMDEQRKFKCRVSLPGVVGMYDVQTQLDKVLAGKIKGQSRLVPV